MGGQVVAFEGHATGTTDFQETLKRILATKPDVIYVSDYYNDAALIARQARKLHFQGTPCWRRRLGFTQADRAGRNLNQRLFLHEPLRPLEIRPPRVRSFVENFKTHYAQDPDALSILGYDSAYLMFEAIKRAGTADGGRRPGLPGRNQHDGRHRAHHLRRKNGTPIKSAVVCEIKDGQVVYRLTVEP